MVTIVPPPFYRLPSDMLQAGYYDFPPASRVIASLEGFRSPTTIDPRDNGSVPWESHRTLESLQTDYEERRRIVDAETRHYTDSHTRRQHHEDRVAANHNFPTSAARPRSIGSRLRRRMTGSLSGSQRGPGPVQFSPASFGIDLPEPSLPSIVSPDMATAEYSGEAEVNRRRKRRRVNGDRPSGRLGFQYGWKGQVVPGQLKMEIHECDGGLHSEAAVVLDRLKYRQENLLRNDKSVYCTDKSKCNIILQHIGETIFDLKKLIIKAPECGFTAPIQEGMIFVSMESKDLIKRTSQYRLRSGSRDDHIPDGASAAMSAAAPPEYRPISRRGDSTSRAVPPPVSNDIPRRSEQPAFHDMESTDIAIEVVARYANHSASAEWANSVVEADSSRNSSPTDQTFGVTTHCDQPSDDEEDESSAQTLADRYQRQLSHRVHLPSLSTPNSDDDPDEILDRAAFARTMGISPPQHTPSRARRRDLPSRIEVAVEGNDTANSSDILTPHARFFIKSEKSTVSVSFDPPVSGKYILLKLWSPSEDQNIDIQSIVAHGFVGLRMFPATELL